MDKPLSMTPLEIGIVVDNFIMAQDLDELKKCTQVAIQYRGTPVLFKYLLQTKLTYQGYNNLHINVNNGDQEKTKHMRDMLDKLNEEFIAQVLLNYRLGVKK